MRSIAIFPCSYTFGASVIGELSNYLHLRVYTDEMLFADVSEQFGVSSEEMKKVICGHMPALNRYSLKKKRYINIMKCSLEAQSMYSPDRRLYYGLHTSLLDIKKNRIFKILVYDDKETRCKRAMQQEGFTDKRAREHIHNHDENVCEWTRFLVNKEAYDQSLYDVVIPVNNRNPFDITTDIAERYNSLESFQKSFQSHPALSVPGNHMYIKNQMSHVG